MFPANADTRGRARVALVTCAPYPPVSDDELPLVGALSRRGVDVVRPAWDGRVDWAGFDGVLLRTTWDYHTRRDAFVDWAEATARVTSLFNPAPVIRWNTDKRYLRELSARGVPMAPTVWLTPEATPETAPDILSICRSRRWTRGFLKPAVGANAEGTVAFATGNPGDCAKAQAAVARAASRGETLMLQPFLEAVETEGELSVIIIDGAVSHGVQKVPKLGDYRVQEDWGATDRPWTPTPSERTFATRAMALAAELIGVPRLLYGRVDMLRLGNGALVLNELELVEPQLFFRHAPQAGETLSDALLRRLERDL